MTVSELQAELGRGNDAVAANAMRLETIRKEIAEQSVAQPDLVVSTMRGWLREGA